MKCLKVFDMIGPQPNLTIDLKDRHKSTLGGTLTIFSILISVMFFILFGLDMISKENPVLYEYRLFNEMSEINLEKIPFLVSVHKAGGFQIKDLIKKVRVYMKFAITNSSDSQQPTIFKFAEFTNSIR
jgi:hypothetical protein